MEFAAEQQTLEFCQQGRKEAFKPLVDAYFACCVRIARAIVGDTEDAKDLAQEAFIAAYRAIDQFTLGRPFYPWLRGILVNRCKVHLRTRRCAFARSKAAAERPGNWVLGAEVSPSPERRRTTDLVRRAMDTLSADDREILVLKHMEGYSYDELAEALGTVASAPVPGTRPALKKLWKNWTRLSSGPGSPRRRLEKKNNERRQDPAAANRADRKQPGLAL